MKTSLAISHFSLIVETAISPKCWQSSPTQHSVISKKKSNHKFYIYFFICMGPSHCLYHSYDTRIHWCL